MDPAHIPPELLKQNKGPLLVIIVWVFAALALMVVSIKVWTRVKILHQSDLENVFHSVFVLLAWVLSLVYGALLTASVYSGLGKHSFALDRQEIDTAIMLYSISIPFGILSVALPALAIAIVLKKITDANHRQLWFLYGIPALNIVIKIINVVLVFSTCPPASFRSRISMSKCVNVSVVTGYFYFATCFSAATAVFLVMWPMVAFWKLQLKRKAKVSLILLFSTTAVAAVCALVRVGYLPRVSRLEDFTYYSIDYTIWVVMEGDVFIITACVPGLRPFVKHLRDRLNQRSQPDQDSKEPNGMGIDSAATALSSPSSTRRMEPRSSGSAIQPSSTNHHHHRIDAPADTEKQAFELWRDGEDEKWARDEDESRDGMENFLGERLRRDDVGGKERRVREVASAMMFESVQSSGEVGRRAVARSMVAGMDLPREERGRRG
ncbi:MAG: hypothetical protein Q9182_001901 [Xanthomendoza sp. 2 TL-2023]